MSKNWSSGDLRSIFFTDGLGMGTRGYITHSRLIPYTHADLFPLVLLEGNIFSYIDLMSDQPDAYSSVLIFTSLPIVQVCLVHLLCHWQHHCNNSSFPATLPSSVQSNLSVWLGDMWHWHLWNVCVDFSGLHSCSDWNLCLLSRKRNSWEIRRVYIAWIRHYEQLHYPSLQLLWSSLTAVGLHSI
jgi:hypothetical protein